VPYLFEGIVLSNSARQCIQLRGRYARHASGRAERDTASHDNAILERYCVNFAFLLYLQSFFICFGDFCLVRFAINMFPLVALLCLFCLTAASPDTTPSNSTTAIILPAGSSNHGDPNLLCRPSQWPDVLIFFLGNYVLHAATARPLPGESLMSRAIATILALLLPSSGVLRGIKAIISGAKFSRSDLVTAARAGAFCTVVREGEDGLARKIDISRPSMYSYIALHMLTIPSVPWLVRDQNS
jgi:hypothetical protein